MIGEATMSTGQPSMKPSDFVRAANAPAVEVAQPMLEVDRIYHAGARHWRTPEEPRYAQVVGVAKGSAGGMRWFNVNILEADGRVHMSTTFLENGQYTSTDFSKEFSIDFKREFISFGECHPNMDTICLHCHKRFGLHKGEMCPPSPRELLDTEEPEQEKGLEKVDHPDHYNQGDIECIDAIQAALTPEEFRGFCKGNVIKYNWRANAKQGLTSYKKAQWYLSRLIKFIEDSL